MTAVHNPKSAPTQAS